MKKILGYNNLINGLYINNSKINPAKQAI